MFSLHFFLNTSDKKSVLTLSFVQNIQFTFIKKRQFLSYKKDELNLKNENGK